MLRFLEEWGTGLLTAGAGVLLAPVLLPALSKIVRPLAKECIGLYLDVAEGVQEGIDEHRRQVVAKVAREAAVQGLQEAAVAAVELEGEESLTEVVVECVTEIIEIL